MISQDGEHLSTANYKANGFWFPVSVPSTVLSGLVTNNVYPSPYFGMNNMLIPDANDSTNKASNLSQYSHLPNTDNNGKEILPSCWSDNYISYGTRPNQDTQSQHPRCQEVKEPPYLSADGWNVDSRIIDLTQDIQ